MSNLAGPWPSSGWPCDPIGFLLRTAAPAHWLRIHFFAEKRYPDTKADEDQVKARFAACGDLLFTTGAKLALYRYGFEPDPDDLDDMLPVAELDCMTAWQPTELHVAVLRTARDEDTSFVLFDPSTLNAMAPYPGGIDLFWAETTQRDRARDPLAPWMSAREDGL